MFKFSKKTYYFIASMIIFLLFLVTDILLIKISLNNYNEKMKIVTTTLSVDNREKVVSEILKGNEDINVNNGENFLKKYGYDKGKNILYENYKLSVITILIGSILFYLIVELFIVCIYKIEKKKLQMDIDSLLKIVSDYKAENFQIENTYLENNSLEQFVNDLRTLGSKLNNLTKRVMSEKEETKALVTDISHQLKTPISALKNSLEILESTELTKEEEKEFYNRSLLQLRGIENLLKSLINISRMEAGIINIHRENSYILETILNAFNTIYPKAEKKNIIIELNAEDNIDDLIISHDKKWLSEAFINILDNGVKYSPRHSKIEINIVKIVSFLRIEFIDNGIGIEKEEYNDVFKRFYRGDNEFVKSNEGSGVGLFLTRKIVSEHFGTVSVYKNKTKKGSTFVIQIPYN